MLAIGPFILPVNVSRKTKFQIDIYALLPLAALCAMAISHPLYDLLMREDHATFFVAHQSKAPDIYLLVFMLSAVLPLVLFIVPWTLNLLSKKLARILYALVLIILLTTLFMPVSQMLFGILDWVNFGVGLSAAIFCTVLFFTTPWVRTLLCFAAITTLVSPALFLTNPAIKSFLSTPEAQDYKLELLGKNYPNIVMIVFDELPLISLLDENRQIDDVRFPNFARLANNSTWFRNTLAAHTTTTKAVPSILTGRYINSNQPIVSSESYPESLLSFLRSTHQLQGVEVVTKFFDLQETQTIPPSFGFGLQKMSLDLTIVLGHLVLPRPVASQLPAIDSNWSDFHQSSPVRGGMLPGRPLLFRKYIELLRNTPRSTPAFFYLHMLLPHSPLRFNDDGRSIGNELYNYGLGTRSPTANTFAGNKQDSLLIYQAHLLQTRFTDVLLGDLLDELESLELFSDSLIIITSDHGIGYAWYEEGEPDIFAMRASEVYRVPFFLKKPKQDWGEIIDEPVVTIDIFPTIAEILDKPIPWAVDGLSAIGFESKEKNRLGTGNPDKSATWFPADNSNFTALERKIELFGQHNLKDLYFFGPNKDLIGRRIDSLQLNAEIPNIGNVILDVQPSSKAKKANIRFYLKGELTSIDPNLHPENLNLAISINGIIWGTTKPSLKDDRMTFITRIPIESWATDENSVSVYAILKDHNGDERSFARFTMVDTK